MKHEELKQYIKKEIRLIKEKVDGEVNINKKDSDNISNYHDLHVQKQAMIKAIKTTLDTEKDPEEKKKLIKKHNSQIKKLNKKIELAELGFNNVLDKFEDED